MVPTDLITPDMERCVAACMDCHRACLRAATGDGLYGRGARLAPEHFRLLLDCADLCTTTADFMLRGSAFHERVSDICADVCDAAAQSCSQFEGADGALAESMRACRSACERCGATCREAGGAIR